MKTKNNIKLTDEETKIILQFRKEKEEKEFRLALSKYFFEINEELLTLGKVLKKLIEISFKP